jgi:hypothetical protein
MSTKHPHLGRNIKRPGSQQFHECTFNPFDKMIELMETNKALYERLPEEKEEKVKLLERMLGK